MTDTRLVPLAAAIWAATVLVPVLPSVWQPVVMATSAGSAVAVLLAPGRMPRLTLLLLGLAAGSAVSGLHARAVHSGPVSDLAAEAAVVTVEVEVRTDPRVRTGEHGRRYVMFDGRIRSLQDDGERYAATARSLVTASPAWRQAEPGQRLRAVARLTATDPGDELAALVSARGPPRVVAEPGPVDRVVNEIRSRLREAVRPLPAAERALLPSLVVGDTTRLPSTLVDDLREAGLTHLTAVSGANLTIVLGAVLAVARAAGVRAWGVPVFGVLVVAGFVLICRPEPSVIRAAAMGLVGLAGLSSGQRRTGLPALAIAVTGLLLADPWLGRSHGFALSVLATAGILVFAPAWTAILGRRLPAWLAAGIAVPLAAQLAVTPVLVPMSGEVSVVALVANLVTGPVVPMTTVFGFAALVVAGASPALASLVAWLAFPGVWWIVRIARSTAALPGATVAWSGGPWQLVALVLGCVLAAIGIGVLLQRMRILIVLTIVMVLWLVRPMPLAENRWITGWPPDDWALAACDVGQGDAVVLRTAANNAVLVDTGPDPSAVDGCLRSLGIHRLDLVVLTHFHHDHTGGLSGAVHGRTVDRLWIRPVTEQNAAVRGLATGGASVEQVGAGSRLRLGPLRLTVLAPDAAPPPEPLGDGEQREGSAENDASVVVRADMPGLRVLLTGDIEPAGQRRLLQHGEELDVDVLKVPHHGARYQEPAFLDRTSARLALISVGADNEYGHPAHSTVAYFERRGVPIARTDRDGAVVVTVTGDRLGLVRRGRSWTRGCRCGVRC